VIEIKRPTPRRLARIAGDPLYCISGTAGRHFALFGLDAHSPLWGLSARRRSLREAVRHIEGLNAETYASQLVRQGVARDYQIEHY
jgi:hypothetical protein